MVLDLFTPGLLAGKGRSEGSKLCVCSYIHVIHVHMHSKERSSSEEGRKGGREGGREGGRKGARELEWKVGR